MQGEMLFLGPAVRVPNADETASMMPCQYAGPQLVS